MKNTKIGIIGGGQLGLLLTQAAITFPVYVSVYDPDPDCPAAPFTQHFFKGNFDDYSALMSFGRKNDVLIFETEKVNVQALFDLEKEGKKIVSSPATLKWIQDKGQQKECLKAGGFPVVPFEYVGKDEVHSYKGPFPVVQKWRTGGYDGYGVKIHPDADSLKEADEKDSIFEAMIEVWKEVSVILARNETGEIALYPVVEMVFDPQANLVDYLLSPARLEEHLVLKLKDLSHKIADHFNFIGLYAIEFFIDSNQKIYVNEIAPRPHNSGHHTVSANITSQYEQQIRVALGLPLGATTALSSCVMVNLLADQSAGLTHYQGLKEAYKIPNVQYIFYGKQTVRPSRKMGHALILENNLEEAIQKMKKIRHTLTITSYEQ